MQLTQTIFIAVVTVFAGAVVFLVTPVMLTGAGAAGGFLVELAFGPILYDIFIAWGFNAMAAIPLWKIGAAFGFVSAFIPRLFAK